LLGTKSRNGKEKQDFIELVFSVKNGFCLKQKKKPMTNRREISPPKVSSSQKGFPFTKD